MTESTSGTRPVLSVVIPTFNEAENIPLLLDRLSDVLAALDHEIVVVDDDSPDGTWKLVERYGERNPRVRCLRRLSGKGLSSAVTAGLLDARGDVLAVMDADLQHDESILPAMVAEVQRPDIDVCVGSREAPGGSYGEWSAKRKAMSLGARWLANLSLGTLVSDPMSGFFALSREYFEATVERVNPAGFKILLEFLARGNAPRTAEVGYAFRNRMHGETKLNATVALEYLLALVDLRFGWLIPNQFVKFGLVGISGSLVNFTGFALLQALGASVTLSVMVGVEAAILWTYFANNRFTFTPMTFRGRDLWRGLLLYQMVAFYGLVIQLAVVQLILTRFPGAQEHLLTLYLAYMAGVAFAAVGNYFLHSYYTWSRLGHAFAHPQRRGRAELAERVS